MFLSSVFDHRHREYDLPEGYLRLLEDVIEKAIDDYVSACRNIVAMDGRPWFSDDIKNYRECVRFFRRGGNGFTGADGDQVIRALNGKYGIDAEKVKRNIQAFESTHWRKDR